MIAESSCPPEIERELTRLMRLLPRLHGRLAAEASLPLDRSVYPVLGRVADAGPIRLTDLAASLGLDLSTVSRQVHDLEEKALLERNPDSRDGRASVLTLSRQGRGVLARVRKARLETLTRLVADWTPADRAELARLLGRLADAVTRYTGGADA